MDYTRGIVEGLLPRILAQAGALEAAMRSAQDGECSGCPCDVCVSLRGLSAGADDVMTDLQAALSGED